MKKAENITIIGHADGPTSVLLAGKEHVSKRNFKQKWQKYIYDRKKKRIERHIRADGHSMEEVAEYLKDIIGCKELDQATEAYQEEYREMRASYIMQYAPELLGEYAKYPQLESQDAEGFQKFQEAMELRRQKAEKVPKEVFDIDLCILEREEDDLTVRVSLESRHSSYIGMSAGGSKKKMKKFKKWEKALWRYYGVTQEDIDHKTTRYNEVVRELAR